MEPTMTFAMPLNTPSAAAARFTARPTRVESISARRALLRATAITGGVLAAMLVLAPIKANAQAVNGTWSGTPANDVYTNGANWNGGVVPNAAGTATFGASTITTLSVANSVQLGTMTFSAGAPAYTFIIGNSSIGGLGIVNGRNVTLVSNTDQFTVGGSASLGEASVTNNRALVFSNSSSAGSSTITTTFGLTAPGSGGTLFLGTSSGGTSRHILTTNGLLAIDLLSSAGTTIGSLEGTGEVGISGKTLTIGSNNLSTTYSGIIRNLGFNSSNAAAGNLAKTGTGTLTLAGTNTYTGTTTVNNGTLLVNGSIATSSGVTVNSGGTIGGTGTLPVTTINSGGTLAPGNNAVGTLSVNGNLTLSTGATTAIEVQGATIDRINVTGTAALAGTVRFAALGGNYTFNSPYTFLQAGAITGTFGTKAEQGSFGDGVTTALSYTATQAQLTLTPGSLSTVVAANAAQQQQPFASMQQQGTGNQFRVASAIDRAVANGANVNAFFNLYNQNRAGILAGLDQLSGAVHAGAPALGQQAGGGFMGAMLNPVAAGRGGAPSGNIITAYAPEADKAWTPAQMALSRALGKLDGKSDIPSIGDHIVATTHFRPAQIYNVWASVTGGTGRVDGEAAIGSVRQSTGFGGVAVGVDARILPDTVVGMAVGGAAGSTTSANAQGKVESNLFQLGLYGSTKFGALSLAASGAWLTGSAEGSRPIPVLGQSNVISKYDLHGLAGRFEAAWAVASLAGVSASPYAAFQATSIRNSSFVETNEVTGVQVGVAGQARTNVVARAELGLKLETATRLGDMPATAFIRAGWGHHTSRDANMTGQLVGLPGSVFTVTGTRPDRNVALLAAGGEVSLTRAVSIGARVDAELGSRTQSVAGTGNVKWAF
jgi:autotransporter-associated beta strand protein